MQKKAELLSLACHATAAQLERLVRACRGVVARACVAGQGGPERHVTWSYADDGSLVLRARLPALDAGVDRLIADRDEHASAEALTPEDASVEAPAPASGEASAESPARASEDASAEAAVSEHASAESPASSPDSACVEAPSIAELRADALV